MHLGRLTLTLFLSSAMGFSTANALAQETPSTPPEKPKTEGEEKPGIEKDLERLNESLKHTADSMKEINEATKELLESVEKLHELVWYVGGWKLREAYKKFRDNGEIPKINAYENSCLVAIPWMMNPKLRIGMYNDEMDFEGFFSKTYKGFAGARLYIRKEGNKEVPFIELMRKKDEKSETTIELVDISQELYQSILKTIEKRKAEQETFCRKVVFHKYEAMMEDYFKEGHAVYRAMFKDMIAQLKKRVGDRDNEIDIRQMLIKSLPAFGSYRDDDEVVIPNPYKKKQQEKKKAG